MSWGPPRQQVSLLAARSRPNCPWTFRGYSFLTFQRPISGLGDTGWGPEFKLRHCRMLLSETSLFTRQGPPSCRTSLKKASIAAIS